MSEFPRPGRDVGRLVEATRALAMRVAEADVRGQLHALAALLDADGAPDTRNNTLDNMLKRDLATALADGDEVRVLAAARALAAEDRRHTPEVNWSVVSRG